MREYLDTAVESIFLTKTDLAKLSGGAKKAGLIILINKDNSEPV